MEMESPISRMRGRLGLSFMEESGRCFPWAQQGAARQVSKKRVSRRFMTGKVGIYLAESKEQFLRTLFYERNF